MSPEAEDCKEKEAGPPKRRNIQKEMPDLGVTLLRAVEPAPTQVTEWKPAKGGCIAPGKILEIVRSCVRCD